MPILSAIGRRSPRVRLLLAAIYAVLIAGSVTMIYPFLLMISGSMKSAVDLKDIELVPRFLYDDNALYRKHVEGLFNESLEMMNSTYDIDVPSFEKVAPPAAIRRGLVGEWARFLEEEGLPSYAYSAGYLQAPVSRTMPMGLRLFKRHVAAEAGSGIDDANRALGTDFVSWNAFFVLPENYLPKVRMPADSALGRALNGFKESQPKELQPVQSPEGYYRRYFLRSVYSRDIAEYNRTHGTSWRSFGQIRLDRAAPPAGPVQKDWEDFVRRALNLLWVRVDEGAAPEYRSFLKGKYGDIRALNRTYGTDYASFGEVSLIREPPFGGAALSDWAVFISGWRDPATGREQKVGIEHLRVHSVDFLFREHLERAYGTLSAVNRGLGSSFASFDDITPPQQEYQYAWFLAHRRDLRWEFATRNYRTVLEHLVFQGRGVVNTAVYCVLAVFFALLVNPLAAYALSRYRMPSTYKILLFLMLTMAFPAMVTQIPVFLMLRRLHLLNTFAALILPGLANGYSIFLLKGFFDSLPRELYESAAIDGAGEWTMFWNITMSLSTPILSVIALQSFVSAYSNFMYALLICQDEKMWTIMVWLYQLQERSGQGVIYASLLIAAIPTFLIFILCQKVILRGIVVPVEK